MVYTTEFEGQFDLDKPLTNEQRKTLEALPIKRFHDMQSGPSSTFCCRWNPTPNGTSIRWSGNGKFYNYVEWLEHIVEEFLKPWGYVLNGRMNWAGEEIFDIGMILVKNNVVQVFRLIEKGEDNYSWEEGRPERRD